MILNLQQIENIINKSHFNKEGYSVDIPLKFFQETFSNYSDNLENKKLTLDNLYKITPNFQRPLGVWTEKMETAFVENIFKGLKTNIYLYNISEIQTSTNNFILDGQHRIQAILKFFANKLPIFNGNFYHDLIDYKALWRINKSISLTIFNFNSEKDAIKFYIEMNENITHDEKDIEFAKSYLN